MIKVRDITEAIEEFAPLSLQEDYDNSGLNVGSADKAVERVLITLDVTSSVIEEAKELHTDIIISHHPIIFNPLYEINTDKVSGERIKSLLINDIAVYAAHTNVDNADENISREYVERLGLINIERIPDNCGTMGDIPTNLPWTLEEVAGKIEKICGETNVKTIGGGKITKVYYANGGNGSDRELFERAAMDGAALITAEVKHHMAVYAAEVGLRVIEIGHYESEKLFIGLIRKKLAERFPDVEFIESKANKSPYNI
jgi:dinuclear metal center YbgI/SA1388 family protein